MLSKTKIECPKTFPFAHAPSVLFKSFWKRVKMIMMLSENKSNRVLHSFFRNIPGVVTLHSEEKPDAFNVKFRKSSGLQGLLGIAPHYSLTLCLTIPPLFHFTLCILAPSPSLKQSHWFGDVLGKLAWGPLHWLFTLLGKLFCQMCVWLPFS